jgi:hypothetical protein
MRRLEELTWTHGIAPAWPGRIGEPQRRRERLLELRAPETVGVLRLAGAAMRQHPR